MTLDICLATTPDQPTTLGLGRAAMTNSLLDQVPMVLDLDYCEWVPVVPLFCDQHQEVFIRYFASCMLVFYFVSLTTLIQTVLGCKFQG